VHPRPHSPIVVASRLALPHACIYLIGHYSGNSDQATLFCAPVSGHGGGLTKLVEGNALSLLTTLILFKPSLLARHPLFFSFTSSFTPFLSSCLFCVSGVFTSAVPESLLENHQHPPTHILMGFSTFSLDCH
jgi:hypothetical protein